MQRDETRVVRNQLVLRISFIAMSACISLTAVANESSLQEKLSFYKQRLLANEQLIGNANLEFEVSTENFPYAGKWPNVVYGLQTHKISLQLAKDGSYKASIDGPVREGEAKTYYLKGPVFWRFLEEFKAANGQPAISTSPNYTVHPTHVSRTNAFDTVLDVLNAPNTTIADFEQSGDISTMLVDYFPNAKSKGVRWELDFSRKQGDMPTAFRVISPSSGATVIAFKCEYVEDRAFLPRSWHRETYSSDQDLMSVEKGTLISREMLSGFARSTTELDFPPGTKVVNMVTGERTLVREPSKNSWWLDKLLYGSP